MSTRATRRRLRAAVTARFTATVDLPTPPFPDPTATVLFRSESCAVIAMRRIRYDEMRSFAMGTDERHNPPLADSGIVRIDLKCPVLWERASGDMP